MKKAPYEEHKVDSPELQYEILGFMEFKVFKLAPNLHIICGNSSLLLNFTPPLIIVVKLCQNSLFLF
jgi:hypothetical protein